MSMPSVSDEQRAREAELVDRVVRSFDGAADVRLKQIMQSLVRHLHGFVREVRLTEQEWSTAIQFLTDCGHITTDKRQEVILLSDVLGLSMQVIGVNNSWVVGRVSDTDGAPIRGARIEVWEADEDGLYDVQYTDGRMAARAHLFTDGSGEYAFWALTPTPYPIPADGPVGRMLAATGRSPLRASHLHFMVRAPGYRTLVTHIFVRGDEIGWADTVFGVKESLIKDFTRHPVGTPTPDGRDVGQQTWSDVRFDIVLAPAEP